MHSHCHAIGSLYQLCFKQTWLTTETLPPLMFWAVYIGSVGLVASGGRSNWSWKTPIVSQQRNGLTKLSSVFPGCHYFACGLKEKFWLTNSPFWAENKWVMAKMSPVHGVNNCHSLKWEGDTQVLYLNVNQTGIGFIDLYQLRTCHLPIIYWSITPVQ